MKTKNFLYILILFALTLTACRQSDLSRVYIIGVSQCCDDIWRQKMNRELDDELVFHPELELRYRQANDNSILQCQQIDSFIHERVDLLIISPNEAIEVQPAVERAYDAGIPVIIADRRIPGSKWTAFVGGDNRQVGIQMANWLKLQQSRLNKTIHVIEITGNMSTTSALLRHEGLQDGLRKEPDIRIVESPCGKWIQNTAETLCDSLLTIHPDIDAIVTQNDMMAFGAALAVERHGKTIPVMGVDGISGEKGGIEAVLKGKIAATAIYPSRGDIILQRAAQILNNEPFPRETNLLSVLVNGPEEARPVAMMYDEHEVQMAALMELRRHMSVMTESYRTQRTATALLVIVLILLVVSVICGWQIYRYKCRIRQQQEEKEELLLRQQQLLNQMTTEVEKSTATAPTPAEEEQHFVDALSNEILSRIADPNLNVESLAHALGICRSVLFRKTKSATGLAPVELIRKLRLSRAQQLIKAGTMTVQQVAYEVGFSSPAYFAKCYKEAYGVSPGDTKKGS